MVGVVRRHGERDRVGRQQRVALVGEDGQPPAVVEQAGEEPAARRRRAGGRRAGRAP
jgi:hypothetical protein